ncbi:MAG: patatin-like phospholipase family protein [Burkholderiaceae bacterium]
MNGLILGGGGARAAYQVGVLHAIHDIAQGCGQGDKNPYQVISGTSAGAIIAAALACRADDHRQAIDALHDVWSGFRAEQVYRADVFGVARTGARWLSMFTVGWAIARWRAARPRSLLDNSPLRDLLAATLPMERIPGLIEAGHLHGLAVTASSYSSGDHVAFYDAVDDIAPWSRSHRLAERTVLGIDHLLASSAIPFAFPAVRLPIAGALEWFGDGSMRQSAPISPAVHLGAERILIVGAGRMHEPERRVTARADYPSLAQIAGHAMSSIFLDALAVDIERLQRVNRTLALLHEGARQRSQLRPIDVLVISPSQRLDDIAARHLKALPRPVRAMLAATGVGEQASDPRGAALASYLLFEGDYTRELIALGRQDALEKREQVIDFFGWR